LLRDAISERLELQVQRLWLHLPPDAGALRARLYAGGVVRDERSLEDGALELLVDLPAAELLTLAALPGVRLLEAQPLPGLAACADLEPYLESEPQAATVRR
jgi:GTP-binding protein HflX